MSGHVSEREKNPIYPQKPPATPSLIAKPMSSGPQRDVSLPTARGDAVAAEWADISIKEYIHSTEISKIEQKLTETEKYS